MRFSTTALISCARGHDTVRRSRVSLIKIRNNRRQSYRRDGIVARGGPHPMLCRAASFAICALCLRRAPAHRYLSSAFNLRLGTYVILHGTATMRQSCVYLRRMPNRCPFILPLLSTPARNSPRKERNRRNSRCQESVWTSDVCRAVKNNRVYFNFILFTNSFDIWWDTCVAFWNIKYIISSLK